MPPLGRQNQRGVPVLSLGIDVGPSPKEKGDHVGPPPTELPNAEPAVILYESDPDTKGEVIAFTDDREKLTGAVTREKDKTMAQDVEKENGEERRRTNEKDRESPEEEKSLPEEKNREIRREEEQKEKTPEKEKENTLADNDNRWEEDREKNKDRFRETETSNGKGKTMERSEEKEYEHLTRQERERFDRWEVGKKLRFPQENKDLGMKAGEVAQVEKMDRESGVITLRKENGEEAKMVPEHTIREMERQKSMEEKSPERKTEEQGKEERKEEKKEVSKEQDRSKEKDPFQDRPEERQERRQEKEREEKKEAPRIERQRGRDGMGY